MDGMFFFSSRRRHTRYWRDWSSDVCFFRSVERLLDIEAEIPEKANVIRVMMMELNRISSHLVCIATGGMEIGALTVMTIGLDRKSTRLNSSHANISYAVFCLKKKKIIPLPIQYSLYLDLSVLVQTVS